MLSEAKATSWAGECSSVCLQSSLAWCDPAMLCKLRGHINGLLTQSILSSWEIGNRATRHCKKASWLQLICVRLEERAQVQPHTQCFSKAQPKGLSSIRTSDNKESALLAPNVLALSFPASQSSNHILKYFERVLKNQEFFYYWTSWRLPHHPLYN